MSSENTIYIGYCVELDFNKYSNKLFDEFVHYLESNVKVKFIISNESLYLFNILLSVNEPYDSFHHSISKTIKEDDLEEMKRLYNLLTGEELSENDIELSILNDVF